MAFILHSKLITGVFTSVTVAGGLYAIYGVINSTAGGKKYNMNSNLKGKTYVVTGASSGIGLATTEALAKNGARVLMACRDREKCVRERRNIVLRTNNKQIFCRTCDLSNPESVHNFANKLRFGDQKVDKIDGLINNAAVMTKDRMVNKGGLEMTMATNYFGHFLLTGLLMDKFLEQTTPVRIVNIGTDLIFRSDDINFDNLNGEPSDLDEKKMKRKKVKFDGYNAYKQSKLAEALFTVELSERLKNTNITVNMADPGRCRTALQRNLSWSQNWLSRYAIPFIGMFLSEKVQTQSLWTILYTVTDPELDNVTGKFIKKLEIEPWSEKILSQENRLKMWLIGEKWTNLDGRIRQLNSDHTEIAP